MLICLAALALLTALGAAAVRYLFEEDDPFLAGGSGSVLALLTVLGFTQLLRPLVGYQGAWPSAVLILVAVGIFCQYRRRWGRLYWPQLGRLHWLAIALLAAASYFVMHTREMKGPEDDFFVHFPLISLLARGHYPPPNPFFENLPLFGHFGRDLLISMLSQLNGHEILPATWALNHWLQLVSLALAVGLGYRGAGPMGAVLLPWFLFCGVSVGSRVGLVDTYDNNNALVYAGLLCFIHLLLGCRGWASWLCLSFLLGTYAIVYETHMLLFVATIVLYAWFTKEHPRRAAATVAAALLVASLMGGPVQDLALRLLHLRQASTGHVQAYESQRVEVHFPKARFLQIELGQETYRRLSYVFETQVLRGLAPPLDSGGYTFIFAPKVLAMHWLGTWLGFLAIIPLAGRRNRCGALLWCFGMLSFVTPGVVDFGAVHEREYFRWEFAAGFCLSGSLALAMANAWGKPRHVFLGMLAVAVLWGGEMRINQAWIWAQQSKILQPFYPTQRAWLLSQESLRLRPDEVDLATRLYFKLSKEDRVVTDIAARAQWDFFKEATLAGLLGCRVVGHQAPPRWMPDGIAPYFHTPNWSVLWQQHQADALAGLGATWLFTTEPQPWLEGLTQLRKEEHSNGVVAYRVMAGTLEGAESPEALEVRSLSLATGSLAQSEVAVPLSLEVINRSSRPISWKGQWRINCDNVEGEPPLLLTDHLELAPGQMKEVRLWFVPPLHEGDYRLQLRMGSRLVGELDFPYHLKSNLQRVSLVDVRWTGRQGEMNRAEVTLGALHAPLDIAGPVKLGWRIYDKQESRYQTPFGLDGFQVVELHLAKGETRKIEVRVRWPEPGDRYRIDFFLWSYSGVEIPLSK